MLSLAAFETNPSLLNLDTRGKYGFTEKDEEGKTVREYHFFGQPTLKWGPDKHWNGRETTEQYLSVSDDVYPVAMASLALCGYDDHKNLDEVTTLRRNDQKDPFFKAGKQDLLIARPPSGMELFTMLDALYDINSFDEQESDSLRMQHYVWRNLKLADDDLLGISEVSPETTVMRYDLMENRSLRGEFVPWVLGQGNNYWNCIKLAEAWGRMLSKRELWASFVLDDNDKKPPLLLQRVQQVKQKYNEKWDTKNINKTWNVFLEKLETAQSTEVPNETNTLLPMSKRIAKLNKRLGNDNNPPVMFSKTGTPIEYPQQRATIKRMPNNIDLGIYCVGLMTRQQLREVREGNNSKNCGIVCVVRVTRQYPRKSKFNGLSSTHARDFITDERLEKLYRMTQNRFTN